MTKHTPGPWTIAPIRDDADRYLVEQANGNTDTSVDDVFIARCTSEADAHLIAAVPDMLDALRAASAIIEAQCVRALRYGINDIDANNTLIEIRAAIAKATP